MPPELRDRGVRVVERLAVPAGLVRDGLDAVALLRPRDDHRRAPAGGEGRGECRIDRRDVVPVDLDRLPAERLRPNAVRIEIPAVHRLAGLAEPVDVDDRGQVVERVEAGVLERLPDRALGHLGVAAQAPDPIRKPIQLLAGERDAHRDRQALTQRSSRHVDPRQDRRRVPLDPAAELAGR